MHVCKFTIVARGDTEADYQEALLEALRRIQGGSLSGTDRNDSSGFYFYGTPNVPEADQPA